MAQLKQDEWPADNEPTTEETEAGLTERDPRGKRRDDPWASDQNDAEGDVITNVDPDNPVD